MWIQPSLTYDRQRDGRMDGVRRKVTTGQTEMERRIGRERKSEREDRGGEADRERDI